MIETIFPSLLVAAISALTYLAYKHPEPFRKNIGAPLLAFGFLVVLLITGYFFGTLSVIIGKLSEEVAKLPGEKGHLQFLATQLSNNYSLIKYVAGICFATLIYLVLLIRLPQILDLKPKSDEEKNT